MSFKLKPDPTFEAIAEISQPGDVEPLRLPLVFRHMTRTQYEAEIVEPKLSVDDAVRRLVVGWKVDEPFTPERFNEFLDDFVPASQDIFRTWLKESRESKRKN